MTLLLILQVLTIDSAIEAYNSGNPEQAYSIVFSMEDTTGFYGDELTEYRAFFSMHTGRYSQSDSLYQLVLDSKYDSIRHKAYINYGELQHLTFNFNERIKYLKKAFELKPYPKLIRIIARHYFQIEADYEKAEQWIDRHPTPQTDKDQAGFDLLQAEFAESKRQYSQAIRYYQQAKISAHKAGLFNYELFSAKGLHRVSVLREQGKKENMQDLFLMVILYLGYRTFKHLRNEQTNADI